MTIALILIAWIALSFPVGVAVGKWLKRRVQ